MKWRAFFHASPGQKLSPAESVKVRFFVVLIHPPGNMMHDFYLSAMGKFALAKEPMGLLEDGGH
jgi:hypothetical protein